MIQGIHNLFVSECSGWDMADQFDIQLYDAVLKCDFGQFKAGTTVDTFILWIMDQENTCVEIFTKDGPEVDGFTPTKSHVFPVEFAWSIGKEQEV